MMEPLNYEFYARDTVEVARNLLGKLLIHCTDGIIRSGMIVETEAYRGCDDPASHSYKGCSRRNSPMFEPVGHAYVYFIYGNHYCLNVVAKDHEQEAGAVLIRAIEPIGGIEEMAKARNFNYDNLTNGPGKLTQAFGITRVHNNCDLTIVGNLWIVEHIRRPARSIKCSSRIGITVATENQWRFYVANNRWVSRR